MRFLLTLFITTFFSINICLSQENIHLLPYKDDAILYERVYEFTGVSKEKLFLASKRWVSTSFVDSKEVLRNDDQVNGELIGIGKSYFHAPKNGIWWVPLINVEYTFMINVKDEKIRLRFFDFSKLDYESKDRLEYIDSKRKASKRKQEREYWNRTVELLNNSIDNLLNDFAKSINKNINDEF